MFSILMQVFWVEESEEKRQKKNTCYGNLKLGQPGDIGCSVLMEQNPHLIYPNTFKLFLLVYGKLSSHTSSKFTSLFKTFIFSD